MKAPAIRLVGVDRPGLVLPDDPGEFEEFVSKDVWERFGMQPMNSQTFDLMRIRVVGHLYSANLRYNFLLRHPEAFWKVDLELVPNDPHTISMQYYPSVLEHPPVIDAFEDMDIIPAPTRAFGGFVARPNHVDTRFVRGPTKIEAIVGLGKLLDPRER